LIAVLRHRATCDLDAAFLQDVDDRLIASDAAFSSDTTFDLRLDAARRDILARRRRQSDERRT
jgi:hypothetical protein